MRIVPTTNSVATVAEPTPGTWQVKLPWAPSAAVWLYRQGWRCSSCGTKPQRCPHIAAVLAATVTLCHTCGSVACERARGVPLCPGHCPR